MISIIVPVYKAQDYIVGTIENVIEQTYSKWELILIDDSSPDESANLIIKTLDQNDEFIRIDDSSPVDYEWERTGGQSRIRLHRKDQNEGAAKARNTGLDIASGRYIAFLDADDVWLPERLKASMEHMMCNQAGFVFSAYEFGDENAKGTGRIVHVPKTLKYKQALSRTVIFTTTTLFDTLVVPKTLIYMPNVSSEDTATWWQILREGYTAYGLDEVLAIYRRPSVSLSSNKFVAIKRIWKLYREVEKLSLITSIVSFVGWAYRATIRRI